MRLRTYLGFLFAVVAVVAVAFLTSLNRELFLTPFKISPEHGVPLFVALLVVFLAGFLPTATILFIKSLERDLWQRRRRRRSRDAERLDGLYRRAVDLQADGQLERAAAVLEEVLTERPEDFSTLVRYGEVLRQLGRVDQALEVHRRASVLYPHDVALLYQLADDYAARGEPQVAHEIENRILRDFPGQGLGVMRRRRDQAVAAGEWDEAGRWQERIESLLKEAGGGAAGDGDVALGLAYQRGVALLEKDRVEEAAAIFRRLLERAPDFVPGAIMLGEAELLQNDADAAVDVWRRGFLRTGNPIFLQRIEDHFIENEEPMRAIETLRGLIAGADDDRLLRFFLGRLYYRIEMHDEALKILDGLREAFDASPAYHYLLGRIHQRRDHPRRALASYLAGLERQGLRHGHFVCARCGERYAEWQDRCGRCNAWNTVGLDVHDELLEVLSPPESSLPRTPQWGNAPAEPRGAGGGRSVER
ncbi:MAG: hypothetical protein D6696_18530 [Acidobacteria bacterium]|nr:MAG: hypothetical protein D6696_18530 [Acidobacteriota bacterium]